MTKLLEILSLLPSDFWKGQAIPCVARSVTEDEMRDLFAKDFARKQTIQRR